MELGEKVLEERYYQLQMKRAPYVARAQQAASLTLPTVFPPNDTSGSFGFFSGGMSFPEPSSGLGARLVVTLASRLMMALIPTGQKFFRLNFNPKIMLKEGLLSTPDEVERRLALIEQLIEEEINRKQWRLATSLSLQNLIVTGNCLEQILPNNTIKVYRLDQYVVRRNSSGDVREIIIQEQVSDLEQKFIYTGVTYDDNKNVWIVYQEVAGIPDKDTYKEYEISPFLALRWSAVTGEDYGRSKCEEHSGDLRALNGLSQAVLDGAAMAARNVMMVRPAAAGGVNLRRRLAEAKNGDVIVGNSEDVTMLQFSNVVGMQYAQIELDRVSQALSSAFVLSSGLRRDAERVTATELRQIAEELESALGGVYSVLSYEMQFHRLNRLIVQMKENKQLPEWYSDFLNLSITIGLDALSREGDVNRLSIALQLIQGLPEPFLQYIRWSDVINKIFSGLGMAEIARSDAEVQELMRQNVAAESGNE